MPSPRRLLLPGIAAAATLALTVGATGGTGGASAQQPSAETSRAHAVARDTAADLPAGSVVANGRVYGLLRHGDTVYAQGDFSQVGHYSGPGDVLDAATGARRNAPTISDGQVSVVVADGAGGWYLGGDFTVIDGRHAGGLAHVLADGSVDPDFLPLTDGLVSAMALVGDTLYVGGDFTEVDEHPREHLAAISTTDGALEAGFVSSQQERVTELVAAPAAGGRTARLFVGSNELVAVDPATGAAVPGFTAPALTGDVRALALSGTRLYVGSAGLVALDATTGAVDPVFGAGLDQDSGVVHSLVVDGARLYVGGDGLTALDPTTGVTDATFSPDVDGEVYDVAIDGDRVWAAGTAGLTPLVTATGADAGVATPAYDQAVNAVELSGGQVFVGGVFWSTDRVRTRGLAALDATTLEPDPGFRSPTIAGGEMLASTRALYVTRTHSMGYDPSPAAAASHHFFTGWSTPVRAFDLTTGAPKPRLRLKVRNLAAATTIGDRLYVARRTQDDVRFPMNMVEAYNGSGRRVASFQVPLPGYVTSLSSVGGDLVVAGSFKRTLANGGPRNAAVLRLDPQTGERRTFFDPKIDGPVYDLVGQDGSLYASGLFRQVYQGDASTRPGVTKVGGRSAKDPTFVPADFLGNRVLLRMHALGRLIWLDGGRDRFLDARTGATTPDPTGWKGLGGMAELDHGYAYAGLLAPNLAGDEGFRLGFVARTD